MKQNNIQYKQILILIFGIFIKEDYYKNMKYQIKFKVNLIELNIHFKQTLKFQIALFRTSIDAKGKKSIKLDKTEPMKMTFTQKNISLQNILTLMTTIIYDQNINKYEQKQAQLQAALQFDGIKKRISCKIDIGSIALKNSEQTIYELKQNDISLFYKCFLIFDQKSPPEVYKNFKEIKQKLAQEDTLSNQGGLKMRRQNINVDGKQSKAKSKGKGVKFCLNYKQVIDSPFHIQRNQQKKISAFSIKNLVEQNEKVQENKSQQQFFPNKNELLNLKNNSYKSVKQISEKQLKNEINELKIQVATLTSNLQQQLKSHKLCKQLLKQEKQIKTQYQIQKSRIQQQCKLLKLNHKLQLQACNQNIQKLKIMIQNKAITKENNQKQIYYANERLKQTNIQNQHQIMILHRDVIRLKSQINQFKQLYNQQQTKNYQLQLQLKTVKDKYQKRIKGYQQQIQILNSRIQQIKSQNKNLKIGSIKDIVEQSQLKKKVQMLEKHIQKKDLQIKNLNQTKKQHQNRQIQDLKQQLTILKNQKYINNQNKKQQSNLQWKIQVQKMKKQIQTLKKGQKNLLVQRSKFQTLNKQLQQQLIKNKLSIANILNTIQETGNQKLISQVYQMTA